MNYTETSQLTKWGRKRQSPPSEVFLFYLSLQWIGWRPPPLGWAIYFPVSTDTNANFTQKHPQDIIKNNVESGCGWSSQHIKWTITKCWSLPHCNCHLFSFSYLKNMKLYSPKFLLLLCVHMCKCLFFCLFVCFPIILSRCVFRFNFSLQRKNF